MSVTAQDWGQVSSAGLVEVLSSVARELAGREAPCSPAVCMEEVEALGRATDLLEVAIAARVGVADRSGQPQQWGHTSTAAWLRAGLGMRGGRAVERRTMAAQLPRLPETARRVRAGDLPHDFAAVIASAVAKLSDEDCGKAEEILLSLVDAGCTVSELTGVAQRIKDVIAERDGREQPPEDARRGRRSWLRLSSSTGGGAFTRGWFNAELKALINARLGPLAKPTGADDPRDHAERMADALATYLSQGQGGFDPILIINLGSQAGSSSSRTTTGPTTWHPADPQSAGPGGSSDAQPGRPTERAANPRSDEHAGSARPRSASAWPTDPAGPVPTWPTDPAGPVPTRPTDPAGPDATSGQSTGAAGTGNDSDELEPTRLPLSRGPGADSGLRPDPELPSDRVPGRAGGDGAVPGGSGDDHDGAGRIAGAQESRPGDAGSGWEHDPGGAEPGWGSAPGPVGLFDDRRLRARLADGTPISPQRARQILLAAGFSTLILGSDGHPLYFGRRTRFASPHQRRVLNARYRTCVVHGCDIPATLCEIDHVQGWCPDGTTDIDRLVPCCSFHNRWKAEHPGRVHITVNGDGLYRYRIIRPSGRASDSQSGDPPSITDPDNPPSAYGPPQMPQRGPRAG